MMKSTASKHDTGPRHQKADLELSGGHVEACFEVYSSMKGTIIVAFLGNYSVFRLGSDCSQCGRAGILSWSQNYGKTKEGEMLSKDTDALWECRDCNAHNSLLGVHSIATLQGQFPCVKQLTGNYGLLFFIINKICLLIYNAKCIIWQWERKGKHIGRHPHIPQMQATDAWSLSFSHLAAKLRFLLLCWFNLLVSF